MTIREELEKREHEILAPWASFSDTSRGRAREEAQCDIRPVYQRDRDRILHTKSFRRLKGKTQVFLTPDGDHYRERMTHTLEVSQNARTIAKALRLNEDLVEAIALGHDLGHTPFGHAGERALDRVCPEGFAHNEQSLRIVDELERSGRGLNLTAEVRDGIVNHKSRCMPQTLEGRVVRLSDKIAYIHHDMDDAIRAGILTDRDVPDDVARVIGLSPPPREEPWWKCLRRSRRPCRRCALSCTRISIPIRWSRARRPGRRPWWRHSTNITGKGPNFFRTIC